MTADLTATPLVTLTDGVLTLPVSLEGKGNSLDSDAVDQAAIALRALLDGEIDAGSVLLVGLGKNFCNGGNVPGFAAAEDRSEHVRELADRLHGVVRMLDEVTVPVVAAVAASRRTVTMVPSTGSLNAWSTRVTAVRSARR